MATQSAGGTVMSALMTSLSAAQSTKTDAVPLHMSNAAVAALPEQVLRVEDLTVSFETPSVYEDLTVFENFEISLPKMHGLFQSLTFRRTPEVRERIDTMAGEVYLRDQLGRRAGQLSHGQKQWLEIGMLLMQEPELLLLDEPVAGMSPREREQTGDLLSRIAQGKSVVVIEHDMDFVKRIAHKVTVLHQGKLLSEGSAAEVQSDRRVIDVYLGH
jgi:urea transport system ATP-binding protein